MGLNDNNIKSKNYVSNIKKTKNYKLLISEKELNKELNNYMSIYKSNKLCKDDLIKIANNFYNLNNVFITYLDNKILSNEELIRLDDIKKKKNHIRCVLYFISMTLIW